jgi:hypothetical protein
MMAFFFFCFTSALNLFWLCFILLSLPFMQGSQSDTFLQLGGAYLLVQKGLKQVILFCLSGKLYHSNSDFPWMLQKLVFLN